MILRRLLPVAILSVLTTSSIHAAGLYRDGVGARSMSMGGTTTAESPSPLDGLFSNPATLGYVDKTTIEVEGLAGFLRGKFDNRANNGSRLSDDGFAGAAAISVPVGPVRFALGINPDMAMRDQWRYRDTPGGADGFTTYGVRDNESSILLLRTALGVSWKINDQFAIGASVGLLYNENRLKTPYVFQSHPVLRSVKTLLDLDTDGYGVNVEAGMTWRPVEAFSMGLSYRSQSKIVTDGHASGNAGVQLTNIGLGAAQHDFSYDAEVTNVFPQQWSLGAAFRPMSRLTLTAQLDWINWENSFDTLEVRLKKGNNQDLNGLVASDRLNDDIPLDWRDQFVIRTGIEYNIDDHWALRAGYSYGRNPVPARTLNPLTAAIMEHTITAGVGYKTERFSVDLAYQWQIPNTVDIHESALAAGEYSDSSIKVGAHLIGISTSVNF